MAEMCSFATISSYFHLPLAEASQKLGICATILKKICRSYGIKRWPHRKIRSIDNMIHKYEDQLQNTHKLEEVKSIQLEINQLKEKREMILKNPNTPIHSFNAKKLKEGDDSDSNIKTNINGKNVIEECYKIIKENYEKQSHNQQSSNHHQSSTIVNENHQIPPTHSLKTAFQLLKTQQFSTPSQTDLKMPSIQSLSPSQITSLSPSVENVVGKKRKVVSIVLDTFPSNNIKIPEISNNVDCTKMSTKKVCLEPKVSFADNVSNLYFGKLDFDNNHNFSNSHNLLPPVSSITSSLPSFSHFCRAMNE